MDIRFQRADIVDALMTYYAVVFIPPTIRLNGITAGVHRTALVAGEIQICINIIGLIDRQIETTADVAGKTIRG